MLEQAAAWKAHIEHVAGDLLLSVGQAVEGIKLSLCSFLHLHGLTTQSETFLPRSNISAAVQGTAAE